METEMEDLEKKKEEANNFSTQYGRFRQAKKNGCYVEAYVLQMQILADHGTWVK